MKSSRKTNIMYNPSPNICLSRAVATPTHVLKNSLTYNLHLYVKISFGDVESGLIL